MRAAVITAFGFALVDLYTNHSVHARFMEVLLSCYASLVYTKDPSVGVV